ncbi:DUF6702 family protein [Croceiramulus getboli]|nr:peptidase E [Flavobacteriaceae bacterium YJPT1-3]
MKFLFICLFLLFNATEVEQHKFYLSVSEVGYSEEDQALQVIIRVFYDDLEDVLQERYDPKIRVDETADQEVLDAWIERYLSQKFKVTVNGQARSGNFLGKRYEDDQVVSYLEFKNVSDPKVIEVENTVLMDLTPEQKNMMHFHIKNKKKSFLLIDGNDKALLNLED